MIEEFIDGKSLEIEVPLMIRKLIKMINKRSLYKRSSAARTKIKRITKFEEEIEKFKEENFVGEV